MLTLTRKPNESILIGDIKVTVTRIGGNRVRLGIDAPAGIPIVRTELLARRTEANGKQD